MLLTFFVTSAWKGGQHVDDVHSLKEVPDWKGARNGNKMAHRACAANATQASHLDAPQIIDVRRCCCLYWNQRRYLLR